MLRSNFAIIMILTSLKFDSIYFSNIHKIIKIIVQKPLHWAINYYLSGDKY